MQYYIGVDLGGTNIRTGIVNENFKIIGMHNIKTELPKTAEEIADLIVKSIYNVLENSQINIKKISNIGIGIPGTIDPEKGIVTFASNLDFHNVPLADMVKEKIGIDVKIKNDANAAILGEMINGSAKGYKNVVMLTLGTGVGGGVIIDGKIYSGSNGLGAELGHVGMMYNGMPCLCGHVGCVERYCSATALIEQTKKAMDINKGSLLWAVAGNNIEKVTGRTVFLAKEKNDEVAVKVVKQYQDYLAYAVTNYINIFQPEIIIIAGGIANQGEKLLKEVREKAYKHSLGYNNIHKTKIETALLGGDAGLIGAAFLHLQ